MRRTAKFYRKNEKVVMEKFGFEPVVGSGSGWIHKEDGENENFLVQLKSTDASSFKLTLLDLQKLIYHADVAKKTPIFMVEFIGEETLLCFRATDIENISKLLEGKEVKHSDLVVSEKPKQKKQIISSSKNSRDAFHKEREKMFGKNKKK